MNPSPDQILPFRVGIAPAAPDAVGEPAILSLGGSARAEVVPAVVVPPTLVDPRGEPLTSLTWDQYLAWRRTKCRPYDYERGPGLAIVPAPGGPELPSSASRVRDRGLEEIDQSVLELIGEVAELCELFLEHGPLVFWGGLREKLIDECGDILFCASWTLDAWGSNPLRGADDLELFRVADDHPLALFARALAAGAPADLLANHRFVTTLGTLVQHTLAVASANAGMLANSFKKLKYQRRAQDVEVQVGRVCETLVAVNQVLVIANSSVEEALKFNMRKLDTRYPDGYRPGQGGGVRAGEGA